MSRAWRVFWGALVGMVGVLALHPATQPYLRQAVTGFGEISTPHVSDQQLDVPRKLGLALHGDTKTATRDLQGLIGQREKTEPSNAFWPQVSTVLEFSQGHIKEAQALWLKSSGKCTTWDDHQYADLLVERNALDQQERAPLAWHAALAVENRSPFFTQTLLRVSRSLIRAASGSADKLRLQSATVRHGVLIRDNAHTVADQLGGVDIVESVYDRADSGSVRKTISARYALVDQMKAAHLPDEAKFMDDAFAANDPLFGLTTQRSSESNEAMIFQAVLLSKGSAAWVWSLLAGVVLWCASVGLRRIKPVELHPAAILSIGLAAALVVQWIARFPALSAGVLLTALLSLFRSHRRSAEQVDLPLTLQFAVMCGALTLTAIIGYTLVLASSANQTLRLEVPSLQFLPSFGMVLICLLLIVLLLCAHIASWTTRYPVFRITTRMLERLGRMMIVVSMVGLIVFTPAVVWLDQRLNRQLTHILINEPQYYLP